MAPLHPHRAFWLIAATYVMVLFASAAPSPLYPVYQELWGFSALTLTLVFAVYVVTMLLSLLTVGSLSDHIGRRPVLAVALALLIGSMILFVVAGDVGTLLAARALQGLATGAAMGTLTATTVDLQPTARLGSTIIGAAPAFGLATGVGVAGLLVEYAPAPRVLVYEIILGLFAALLIALLVVPETRDAAGFRSRRHLAATIAPRARVPREVRGVFLAAVPTLIATWSLGGLYLSLGSSVVAKVFGVANHGWAGLILFSFFASATVTSLFVTVRTAAAKQAYGYPTLALGVLLSLSGVLAESLPLYVLGSIVAGSGWAATFLSAMDTITAATPQAQRGQVFSSVFVASYLAFSVPAVIAGVVVPHIGLRATVIGYVGYVLVVAVIGAVLAVATRRAAARAATSPSARVEDRKAAPADR
ncbi:MFS transporter [Gordonia paraffinivorans]|uniref:MFS transporter n=1 Tax=Gordonia paraffinivorans TaxID=175628 RepID=UPI001C92C74F|nr:MFS transporter [Gordonia paraffinivorans]MBY4573834.1 MFS transporter [Gordonia paraffinivorans]